MSDPWRFRNFLEDETRGRESPPGVFVSLHRYHMDERVLVDLALDVDWSDNPRRIEAYDGIRLLDRELRERGIRIRWAISGNGMHGYLDLGPLGSLGSERLREVTAGKPWARYSELVELFEDFLAFKGYRVRFDHKIYRERGLIRALYSPHRAGLVLWPVRLNMPLFGYGGLRAMNPWRYQAPGPGWGRLENVDTFVRLLEAASLNVADPGALPQPPRARPVRLRGGRRSVRVDGREVIYPEEFEGYGWIQFLVESEVYPADGRQTLTWRVLGPAVSHGIVSADQAESYLRRCLEAKPDPDGEDVEHYLRKLRYNSKAKANPPTWRTLLTLQGKFGPSKDPEGLRHLRDNLLQALSEAGVVEVREVAE